MEKFRNEQKKQKIYQRNEDQKKQKQSSNIIIEIDNENDDAMSKKFLSNTNQKDEDSNDTILLGDTFNKNMSETQNFKDMIKTENKYYSHKKDSMMSNANKTQSFKESDIKPIKKKKQKGPNDKTYDNKITSNLEINQLINENCKSCGVLAKKLRKAESRIINYYIENAKLRQCINMGNNHKADFPNNSVSMIKPTSFEINDLTANNETHTFNNNNQSITVKDLRQDIENKEGQQSEEVLNKIEFLMSELTRLMDNLENKQDFTVDNRDHLTNSLSNLYNNTVNMNNQTNAHSNTINFNTSNTNILNSRENSQLNANNITNNLILNNQTNPENDKTQDIYKDTNYSHSTADKKMNILTQKKTNSKIEIEEDESANFGLNDQFMDIDPKYVNGKQWKLDKKKKKDKGDKNESKKKPSN